MRVRLRQQGPWALWWLTLLTCGIYYFIWYARINKELSAVLGTPVTADGKWWSQIIPVFSIVSLARTAGRVNAAHAAVGSEVRVGVFKAVVLAPLWFASHTRYLQRRINLVADVIAAQSAPAEQVPAVS